MAKEHLGHYQGNVLFAIGSEIKFILKSLFNN
jgi:hypothetical protein